MWRKDSVSELGIEGSLPIQSLYALKDTTVLAFDWVPLGLKMASVVIYLLLMGGGNHYIMYMVQQSLQWLDF